MKTVSLTIDSRKITAPEGQSILWTALDNGIYIPNLCSLRDKEEPSASCRLCFVEIEGKKQPVTACTEKVAEGMVVNTRGKEALRLARAGFELLMASHLLDCAHCAANGSCELQKIARCLGVKLKTKQLRTILRNLPVDDSNPLFTYDPNKCVLCGRCVWICRERLGAGFLGIARRGFQRVVTTFADEPMGNNTCQQCGECVKACPTGALAFKPGTDEIKTERR